MNKKAAWTAKSLERIVEKKGCMCSEKRGTIRFQGKAAHRFQNESEISYFLQEQLGLWLSTSARYALPTLEETLTMRPALRHASAGPEKDESIGWTSTSRQRFATFALPSRLYRLIYEM